MEHPLLIRTHHFLVGMAFLVAALATLISRGGEQIDAIPYFAIVCLGSFLSLLYAFMNHNDADSDKVKIDATHTWLIPIAFLLFWIVMAAYYPVRIWEGEWEEHAFWVWLAGGMLAILLVVTLTCFATPLWKSWKDKFCKKCPKE